MSWCNSYGLITNFNTLIAVVQTRASPKPDGETRSLFYFFTLKQITSYLLNDPNSLMLHKSLCVLCINKSEQMLKEKDRSQCCSSCRRSCDCVSSLRLELSPGHMSVSTKVTWWDGEGGGWGKEGCLLKTLTNAYSSEWIASAIIEPWITLRQTPLSAELRHDSWALLWLLLSNCAFFLPHNLLFMGRLNWSASPDDPSFFN